jgi:hypothetical protein
MRDLEPKELEYLNNMSDKDRQEFIDANVESETDPLIESENKLINSNDILTKSIDKATTAINKATG